MKKCNCFSLVCISCNFSACSMGMAALQCSQGEKLWEQLIPTQLRRARSKDAVWGWAYPCLHSTWCELPAEQKAAVPAGMGTWVVVTQVRTWRCPSWARAGGSFPSWEGWGCRRRMSLLTLPERNKTHPPVCSCSPGCVGVANRYT